MSYYEANIKIIDLISKWVTDPFTAARHAQLTLARMEIAAQEDLEIVYVPKSKWQQRLDDMKKAQEERKSKIRYTSGDKVRIIKNTSDHRGKIGQEYIFVSYGAQSESGDSIVVLRFPHWLGDFSLIDTEIEIAK